MSNTKVECSGNHTQVSQLLNIHWKQTVVTVGSWGGTGHKVYSGSIYKLVMTLYPCSFLGGCAEGWTQSSKPSSHQAVVRIWLWLLCLTNLCKDRMASQIKQRPLKDTLISTALVNIWESTTGSALCWRVFVTCFANSELIFNYKYFSSSVFHASYNWIHLYLLPQSKISRKILSINKQSQ